MYPLQNGGEIRAGKAWSELYLFGVRGSRAQWGNFTRTENAAGWRLKKIRA